MVPKRFSVKFYVDDPDSVQLEQYVPIFQRWIQERAVEGLLIDVADYKHLHHGPGVILVGHEADYALDIADGTPGLRYKVKRHSYESFTDALTATLQRAIIAVEKLEQEPDLDGVHFNLDRVEINLIDRLQFSNDPHGFAAIEAELSSFAQGLSADSKIAYLDTDPRQPLTVVLLLGKDLSPSESLATF